MDTIYNNIYFSNGDNQELYSEDVCSDSCTNRLIVKSSEKLDPLNSTNYVSGYNDLYVMQFANSKDFIAAYKYYSTLESVEYLQEDLYCSVQSTEETTENIDETTENIQETTENIEENKPEFNPTQTHSDIFGFTALNTYLENNSISYTGEIEIAVLDSGVANDHPIFEDKIEPTGFNSINQDDDCYDDYGHGTHVAGIIAANTLDNIVIKPYKVLNEKGVGTDLQVYLGIEQAVADGVDIINMSLSRRGYSSVLYEAVKNADDNGVVIVASSGNNGVSLSQVTFSPADFEEVITVGSCSNDFYVSKFSNYAGETDVFAPGEEVNSASFNGGYETRSGTSMSAPFISAAVSYVMFAFPEYSRKQIETTLQNNGKPCKASTGSNYIYAEFITREKEPSTTPFFSYTNTLFSSPFDLTIFCEDEDAEIYYNTSMMPEGEFALYTEPISVKHDMTVSAFTISNGFDKSSIYTCTYTRKAPTDTSVFIVNSSGTLTGCSGTDPDVVVPTKVNGVYVRSIAADLFKGNTDINSITFPGYVTAIPDNAFEGCTNLDFVRMNSVTSIGKNAFNGCSDLIRVASDKVTSVGDYAFYGCDKLRLFSFTLVSTVGISAFEGTSSLETIGSNSIFSVASRAFYGSGIADAIFNNATFIGNGSFKNCENLQYIYGPRITSVGSDAFSGCGKLISVELDALKNADSSVFADACSIEAFSADSLTNIPADFFYNCTQLSEISFDSLKTIGDRAFYNTAITSAVFDNVTSVGINAFGKCSKLTQVSFNSINTFDFSMLLDSPKITSISLAKVTNISWESLSGFPGLIYYFPNIAEFNVPLLEHIPDNMFKDCSAFGSLTFTNLKSVGDYAFYNANIESVTLNKVTRVGDYAFYNTAITSASLNSATEVGAYSFYNCDGLTSINLPLVTDLGEKAFSECDNISEFSADSLNSFDFSSIGDCSKLTKLSLDSAESITSSGSDFDFSNLPLLETIVANGITTLSDNSFKNCTSLKTALLNSVVTIGASAFENTGITTFSAPNARAIGDYCFKNCVNITSFEFPLASSIGAGAFSGCTGLTTLKLENSRTSIGDNAFENCTALKTFIADGADSFDLNVLMGCDTLETLSLNSVTEFSKNEFSNESTVGNILPKLKSFSANSLLSVPQYMFYNCKNIETVSLNSITSISEFTFEGSGIRKATFPKVVSIDNFAFYNCENLNTIELPKLTSLGMDAFNGCYNLATLKLNALKEIPFFEDFIYNFADLTQLKTLEMDSLYTVPDYFLDGAYVRNVSFDGATDIGDYAFRNSQVTTTSFDSLERIGNNSFENCDYLKSFDFSILESIGNYAFKDSGLVEVVFDSPTQLGVGVFRGCHSVDNFEFWDMPNLTLNSLIGASNFALYLSPISFSCGGLTEIPDSFFASCTSLTEVNFPDVTVVGKNAFNGCTGLKIVTIPNIKTLNDNAFYGCTNFLARDIVELVEELGACALTNTKSTSKNSMYSADFKNLKIANKNAFEGVYFIHAKFPNIENIYDLPETDDYVLIGSVVKSIGYCEDVESKVVAVTGTPVLEYSASNDLGWLPYNSTNAILEDVSEAVTFSGAYKESPVEFEVLGFDTVDYKWYSASKPDFSDAELIGIKRRLDSIAGIADDPFVYCVATTSVNGNVYEFKSEVMVVLDNAFEASETSYLDYNYIYSGKNECIGEFDLIDVKEGFRLVVLPSFASGTTEGYGTGSVVYMYYNGKPLYSFTEIMQGDVTGDGVVDVLDQTVLINHLFDHKKINDENYLLAADCSGNGSVDLTDYQCFINKVLSQ